MAANLTIGSIDPYVLVLTMFAEIYFDMTKLKPLEINKELSYVN